MRKWDENFYHDWKLGDDSLIFHVAINRLPENVRKYGDYQFMADAVDKIQEEDENFYSPVLGTRRPSTRGERRKATRRAKNHRQALAKYSDDFIMPNSGKVKNTGYRSYEKGVKVYHRNKKIQVESTVSPFNPWEPEQNFAGEDDYNYISGDGGRVWRQAETLHDFMEEFPTGEIEYEEEEYLDPYDDFDFPLPEKQLQAQVNSLKNQVENLKNEINRLNGFIQEFNLQKLYEAFLEKNNEEYF